MDDLLWLSKALSARDPALLHPPRGVAWWRTRAGLVWADGERVWADLGGRVAVVPTAGEVDVIGLGDGVLVTDAGGGSWRIAGAGIRRCSGRQRREGADLEAHRPRRKPWVVRIGPREIPLPEGAREALDVWPWQVGAGLLWSLEGWLYRWAMGEEPRAVAMLPEGATVAAGPLGAFLVGRDGLWTDGAAPGRSAAPLPEPIAAGDWGVRWSPDGRRVSGAGGGDEAVRIALVTMSVEARSPGALPLDGEGALLGADGALPGRDAVIEASWALQGERLGGPGGLIWDLSTGEALFTRPALRLGATVPTPSGWMTVGWEDGRGHWVDPETGAIRDPFVVPLDEDDVIEEGFAEGGAAYVYTALGRWYTIDGPRVAPAKRQPIPPALPEAGPGWRLGPSGLQVAGQPLLPLPFEAAALVAGRVWAWSSDGLLVAVRAGVPGFA